MASDQPTLTERIVESLSYDIAGPARQVQWDGKLAGFGCRVTPSGGKQYVLFYRFNGRSRFMSLGAVDHFESVRLAREKAYALLHGLRHDGIDPMGSRSQIKAAATINEIWQDYDATVVENRPYNTQRTLRSLFRKHIVPHVGQLKPPQLTKGDVVLLHDRVTAGGGKVSANRCVQRLSGLLNWAFERSERSFPRGWRNPCEGVRLHREHARKQILTADQMRSYIVALEQEPNPYVKAYLCLMLLSGPRPSEMRTLRWSDVNLDAGSAFLGKTKSGEERYLQLVPAAVAILRTLPVIEGTDCVFPGRPITQPMSPPYREHRAALARAELPRRTLHDMRRSFGTNLAMLGAGSSQVAAALGNTTDVAARVYVQIAGSMVRGLATQHAEALLPEIVPA